MKKVTGAERLYWYCQLVLHGHSSEEAKTILEEAVKKAEAGEAE